MKIVVTGVSGQLGYDVARELLSRGCAVVGSDLKENERSAQLRQEAGYAFLPLDFTDEAETSRVIVKARPDAVIHCAAWTAVDAAEEEENIAAAEAVNVAGTKHIASACKELGCKLIYISTDYVFDGQGTKPWEPDATEFGPLSVYGRTKLAGEQAVQALLTKYFIVRIAWAFGLNGNNFVKTMLQVGKKHDTLRVVKDQIGTPTYTRDLARLLGDMAESEHYGCYHATNEGGYISWYEFACEIFRQAGYETKVVPVTTEEYGLSKAKRPQNSRLEKSKLAEAGFCPLPDWKDALARYLKELEK